MHIYKVYKIEKWSKITKYIKTMVHQFCNFFPTSKNKLTNVFIYNGRLREF